MERDIHKYRCGGRRNDGSGVCVKGGCDGKCMNRMIGAMGVKVLGNCGGEGRVKCVYSKQMGLAGQDLGSEYTEEWRGTARGIERRKNRRLKAM